MEPLARIDPPGGVAAERPSRAPTRFLLRGESLIASVGIAAAAIVLASMAACGGWMLRSERHAFEIARRDQVHSISALLRQSSESLLERDELTAVRRLIADAGRDYKLTRCRIVLPDGRVLAANEPSQITVRTLPVAWAGARPLPSGPNGNRPGGETEESTAGVISLSSPLSVAGRGSASLDIAAAVNSPLTTLLEAQSGVGAIGAVGLFAMLLVYRHLRTRLRGLAAIGESLLAIGRGESDLAALAVSADLGPEAAGWNQLLAEKEQTRKQMVADKARESLTSRRESKTDLDSAFDAMPQGLVLLTDKMQVRYCNGAAAVFMQAKREEILNADMANFVTNEAVIQAIRAVATGTARRRFTVEQDRGLEGGSGVLKFSVRPVRREDSAAAMVIIEDITQQRVADEARNAFVTQATHELRTPLTNIRLYVETAIEEGEKDPATRAKCLNVINQEARRLEGIVTEMLSVAEIEAGQFKIHKGDVRLDALFPEIAGDYGAAAKAKKIKLRFTLPPKLPVIQGDREKIALALHNLIGNALKYTPNGGQVSVNIEADKKELRVEVTDTGIGISEEDIKRIFEKFYRAKDPRVAKVTGTGLGLTLAREVVRLHGGDITVESTLDKGSTFTVTLPIVAEGMQ